MSYTLRGRIESRLGASLLPFLAACALAVALETWWPLEVVGLMTGIGLALDLVYHRVLDYQAGWLALPLGLAELGLTMGAVFALVDMKRNTVRGTTLRGVSMTEMSMGAIKDNDVAGALGVGIFCADYSHCEVEGNTVVGTRPDYASQDRTRLGYAIQAHSGAVVELDDNALGGSPVGAFVKARIERR